MTDSSDEQEKMQYVKQDLFQPVSRPWHRHDGDDDSNQYFMSEPSMSEADDSSDQYSRLLTPMGSFTEDEEEQGHLPQPPPSSARLLTTQPPASPGNTSLSSLESSHLTRRVHLHFSPDRREQKSSTVKVETAEDARLTMQPTTIQHVDDHRALSGNAKIPDRSLVSDNQQSSTSTSPASEGHQRRLEDFLNDLRINSQGQMQESAMGANTSFESSHQGPNNRTDILRPRQNDLLSRHERVSSMDTAIMRNTAASDIPISALTQDARANATDDTIVMTLSLSEDDDDTKETAAGESSSSVPLDWEQEHSADDEKTADRPRRVRGKPGHRRLRSGDTAAATLSTGRSDWKGMDKDNIPLPPVPCEHDETDNDEEIQRDRVREEQRDINKDQISSKDGGIVPSLRGTVGEAAEISKFALGTSGNDSSPSRRYTRRQQRRDFRSRKKAGLTINAEDTSSLASSFATIGTSSRGDHSMQPPHALARSSSQPLTSLSGHSASPYGAYDSRQQNYPLNWNPSPRSLNSDHTENSVSQNPHWSPQWNHATSPTYYYSSQVGVGSNELAGYSSRSEGTRGSSSEARPPRAGQSGMFGSASSLFSGKSPSDSSANGNDGTETEMSPLFTAKVQEKEKSFHFPFQSSPHESNYQTPREQESPLSAILRISPFANVGKSVFKDRRRFLPHTSPAGEARRSYQYFICPTCKTQQREFFTVSSAPRQLESASGYLALYFAIYVIIALYIFGLQEEWGKLDCIYFAVITLTTAGLGDFVPTSDGAKVMCSIFIYFGVACIGLLLGSYIAGMLDESSRREARANRIKSCPNCARIKNIKEAAERRHKGTFFRGEQTAPFGQFGASMHKNQESFERSPKKIKRNHGKHSEAVDAGAGANPPQRAQKRLSQGSERSRGEGVNVAPVQVGDFPSTPQNQQQQKQILGSPLTSQILGRQSHTRHASLDLLGGQFSAALFSVERGTERRTYTTDFPTTIDESMSALDKGLVPPSTKWQSHGDDEYSDGTSSEPGSISSDSEDAIDELEAQYSVAKNAKYVFLTLREALLNSMVIIAFGCMGFYFIEGFSIIDSWYFTTVLLTTVGYGDIVPYTKGGKLFATVYILVAGTILLNNMSMISMIPLELRRRRTEKAVLTQFGDQLDDAALRELATGPLIQRLNLSSQNPGGLDECTREMFSLAMLVRLGKVTEQDIKLAFAAFRKLDVHNDGVLNSKAIIAGMIQRRKIASSSNLNRMGQQQQQQQQQQPQHVYQPALASPNLPNATFSSSGRSGYGNWFYGSEDNQGSWAQPQSQNEQSTLLSGQPSYNSINLERHSSS